MSETTEDCECCCNLCKGVEDNEQIFKDKVLMNRIHKCSIVDTLTETQDVNMYDMYERMRNKPAENIQ